MAKTENPIGKGTRQIVINLHTEEERAPQGSILNLGEIAVQGTNTGAKLYTKRANGDVAVFIESATTHNAIQAAVDEVEGYARAQGYALSGNLDTLSATVVSDYATSANTEQAIATAKAGVIGQSGDDKTADTIYGAKAYANSIVAETSITGATGDNYVYANKDGLNIVVSANTGAVATDTGKLAVTDNVKAYVGSVSGDIETKINTVSGNVENKINEVSEKVETQINTVSGYLETAIKEEASARTDADKALSDRIDAIESGSVVTVEKLGTPSSSAYAASYVVKQNGEQVGTAIDIPKDYLVKSATIEVCKTADTPVQGLQPDDKYIDFVVNAKDGEGEKSHIYLPVADLAHVYSAGNGVEISSGDVVSAKVVAANGLSVDSNGIAMSLADGSNNGAMSSAHYTKLEGIETGAQVNKLEGVKVNGADLTIDGEKKVNIIMSAATGDNNGQVKINGENIDVKGLGSAAYEDTTAFDAAGAADAVLGTAADTSANITVYGVKDYAKQYADSIVASSLTGATGDTLVNATTNGKVVEVSATQKLQDAVASAHNHANKDVLDGITAGQVTAWDAAEQNAKDYADGIVSGLSGNIITYVNNASGNIETALGSYATSADTVSAIATAKSEVIGTTGDTSSDTTIEGVKKYVDEKVAGESIASVDVNNKDAMAISATTVDRAVTLDFTNMIIDCGTY